MSGLFDNTVQWSKEDYIIEIGSMIYFQFEQQGIKIKSLSIDST